MPLFFSKKAIICFGFFLVIFYLYTANTEYMSGDQSDEYLKEQYKTLSYSQDQFDKNVLYIASGALGISFAFIEKIVDIKSAIEKGFLIGAWYSFACVIFFSLISHFVSILAMRWSIKTPTESPCYNFKASLWNWPIRILNILMIFGLLFGVVLLITFINKNINL